MVDRPFRIGDRIEIQDLDTWGDVVDIGLRSSRIRTRDNRMAIVPNSVIGKSMVVNYSYPDTQYRIQIHIGLGYGTDIEFARKLIVDTVRDVEGVLQDKLVEALFLEFGDSALIFRVRWWLDTYYDARRMFDKVNTALFYALTEAGIEMPYPQLEVHYNPDQVG
jgi:small-conductance mechanosensitive channel